MSIKNNHHLQAQFYLIEAIRQFFRREKFLDVLTPPMVPQPGMEPHIHPFQLCRAQTGEKVPYYLHTSPEFAMKELLSHGFKKIFTVGYVFRDEPLSAIHRPQFLMLEWYRAGSNYRKIMDDCEALYSFCLRFLQQKKISLRVKNKKIKFKRMTVQQLFQKYLGFDILDYLEKEKLRLLIEKDFKDVPLPASDLPWDDYFFLLFLNKIGPHLEEIPYLILDQFPNHLSALATLTPRDPRVCQRFEIYLHGIEVGNCFNELTDLKEQQKRFFAQNALKEKCYNYSLPSPEILFQSLNRGLPPSSGIAIGVERLLFALTAKENIFWS
ncbi:MAG: EF-P lysine aminoacylase EpmA [Pseudomonadota bacterium]